MSFRQLLREPMLHFFVLASALFLINQALSVTQKTRIVVDAQTAERLIRQREDLQLRVLTAEERADTIAAYVEDEILYAEAYNRGLDRDDSRIRRSLILKMRGLLTGDITPPSDTELRQFFEENQQRFAREASLTIDHVYFGDAAAIAQGLLDRLNAGLDPATVGDNTFELPRRIQGMTHEAVTGTFGRDAAGHILRIRDERWHGPFLSARGAHIVRVVERHPARQATYDSVRPYLEGDWLMQQSRKRIREEVDRLSAGYEVVIEPATDA